jgi:hypothetical protein
MTDLFHAKQAQRTPGPYKVSAWDKSLIINDERDILCGVGIDQAELLDDRDVADRNFIIEACNAYDAHVARIAELEAALREIAYASPRDDGYDAYDAAGRYQSVARAALAKGEA